MMLMFRGLIDPFTVSLFIWFFLLKFNLFFVNVPNGVSVIDSIKFLQNFFCLYENAALPASFSDVSLFSRNKSARKGPREGEKARASLLSPSRDPSCARSRIIFSCF